MGEIRKINVNGSQYTVGGGGENYEIEFSFTNQENEDSTIVGLLPKDTKVESFIVNYINNELENLGLSDRVSNIPDVIALAEEYKDNIGAVIVCLLCTFMMGKIAVLEDRVAMCYFLLYGEDQSDPNQWNILVDKFGSAVYLRIAEYGSTGYDITTSYLHSVTLIN